MQITPDWTDDAHGIALYCADCLDVLAEMAPDSVDAVVTDPPYSERTHSGHNAGVRENYEEAQRTQLHYKPWSTADVDVAAAEFSRVSKGWIAAMCDDDFMPVWKQALRAQGRYVFASVPYYAPGSRVRLQGDGPSSWTTYIVVSRTKSQVRWGTLPGGYLHQPGWGRPEYIGGKPEGLMVSLVRDYSRAGDLVLDPCMGGGTTGVACVRTGRRFIGIEIDRDAFDLSVERIRKAIDDNALVEYAEAQGEQLKLAPLT